jgi:hypothetical protein
MEVIRTNINIARKEHRCSFCGCKISKGEQYRHSTNKCDGSLYVWKEHLHCADLCNEIWDYVDPDDGMTSDDFCDAIKELAHTFYCPFHCDKFDKETRDCDGFDNDSCVRKFAEFMQSRELRLVLDPNCGMCWRLTKKEGAK